MATAGPTRRSSWPGRIRAASRRAISPKAPPARSSRRGSPWPIPARRRRACCCATRPIPARRRRRCWSCPPRARRFVNVGNVPSLESASFSTVIEADAPIVADRSMFWSSAILRLARRDQRRQPVDDLVPRRRRDARRLRPVLPAAEPEPDDGGERRSPLPAADRRAARAHLHRAAVAAAHRLRRPGARPRGRRRLGRRSPASTPCRSSSSARCTTRGRARRSPPATPAPRSPRRRRSGSSPKAPPAPSSICSCCSPTRRRRRPTSASPTCARTARRSSGRARSPPNSRDHHLRRAGGPGAGRHRRCPPSSNRSTRVGIVAERAMWWPAVGRLAGGAQLAGRDGRRVALGLRATARSARRRSTRRPTS